MALIAQYRRWRRAAEWRDRFDGRGAQSRGLASRKTQRFTARRALHR
jgi:hypothetical protein